MVNSINSQAHNRPVKYILWGGGLVLLAFITLQFWHWYQNRNIGTFHLYIEDDHISYNQRLSEVFNLSPDDRNAIGRVSRKHSLILYGPENTTFLAFENIA
ncbi:MAG: hypothetical protein AAF723_04845, partial [Pseudomonadota bacterium]